MTAPRAPKINYYLDFLIQDCLKEYEQDNIPYSIDIPSTTQLAQSDVTDFPIQSLGQRGGVVSPVSPVDVKQEAPKGQFNCQLCAKTYNTKRQLKRHLIKHNRSEMYTCTVDGCEKTSHRMDSIRSHARAHEKRISQLAELHKQHSERQLF
jgi:hypothetical protein